MTITRTTDIFGLPTVSDLGPDPGPQVQRSGPVYADIGAILDGTDNPTASPNIARRDDDACLIYMGQVNFLFGDPESGKTWVALAALAEVLHAGGRGLFIDLDHNSAAALVARLVGLGVDPVILRDPSQFRIAEPSDYAEMLAIVDDAATWDPSVVVVDSLGELTPLAGRKTNSDDDLTSVHSRVLKPLARLGAAVIVVDHLAKNAESRAYGPTGTAAKKRMCGGVMLRATVEDPFTPGRGGSLTLTITKDRHGGVRQHCPAPAAGREAIAAIFALTDDDGDLTATFRSPTAGDLAPVTGASASDVDALDQLDPQPTSRADVKDRMGWGTARAGAALKSWRDRQVRNTNAGDESPGQGRTSGPQDQGQVRRSNTAEAGAAA